VQCSIDLKYSRLKPESERTPEEQEAFRRLILVEKTVQSTVNGGRIPAHIRRPDFIANLIEEAVAACLETLDQPDRTDEEIITAACSATRQLIHQQWEEFRWLETGEDGKRVRRSESVLRIEHPVKIIDAETGKVEWFDSTENIPCDQTGQRVNDPRANINAVEARLVELLDVQVLRMKILELIGPDNYRFMAEYLEHKESPGAISDADRQKFHRLKEKCQKVCHETPLLTVIE